MRRPGRGRQAMAFTKMLRNQAPQVVGVTAARKTQNADRETMHRNLFARQELEICRSSPGREHQSKKQSYGLQPIASFDSAVKFTFL